MVRSDLPPVLAKVVSFVRGGYPEDVPSTDYFPLLAVLPRRLPLREVIASEDPKAVERWIDAVTDVWDRARELAALSKIEFGKLGELLDPENGAELIESVDDNLAAQLLEAMAPSRAALMLDALDSDQATSIMRQINLEISPGCGCSRDVSG